jgi:nitronate monooxygenase
LIRAGSADTVITDAYTGLYARLLRNSYIEQYDASGAPALPGYVQLGLNNDIVAHALNRQDPQFYPCWAGQGVGLVRDVRPARDVMQQLIAEAAKAVESVAALR